MTTPGASAAERLAAAAQVLAAPYRPTWGCRDDDPVQGALDTLYDYADDPETRVLHRSRLNRFHGVVSALISRGALPRRQAALDLGCNAGYYTKMISDFGFADVLGVDLEARFITRAYAAFASRAPGCRRRFEVANAEDLDATDAYDLILCTEVLEHTTHPDRVIERLARALAPGGIAIVTLPNRNSLPYGWAILVHALKRQPWDPVLRDHLSWPSSRARRVLSPMGLRLIGTSGANLTLAGPMIRALHRTAVFPALHRLDAALAGVPGLRPFAQFYFTVWRKGD
jgi:SAM-dependent methyltransferase